MMRSTALFCLLSVSGLCYLTLSISPPQYHYISLQMNYSQAQTYCRDMYTDLATIYNSGDLDRLVQLVPNGTASVWIGLEFGDEFEWHWSLPDQRNIEFFNWRAAEPKQNNTQDSCAAMDPNGQWFEDNCQIKRGFVCFDGKNASNSHIFIDDSKTWREAQDHCRGTYTDLASIRSREENHHVQNMSLSQSMWIGLFKDPWKWSDGSNSSYRFWKTNQPNNFRGDQNCTSVILNDNKWNVQWCNISWGFVCHGEMKRPTTQMPPTTPPTATVLATAEQSTTDEVTPKLTTTHFVQIQHILLDLLPTSDQATTVGLPVQNTPSTPVPTTFTTTDQGSIEQLTTKHLTTEHGTTVKKPTTFNTTVNVTKQLTTERLTSDQATIVPVQSNISMPVPTSLISTEHASTEQLATEHLTSDPATPVPVQSNISMPVATTLTREQATTGYIPTSATFKTTVRVSTEHTSSDQAITAPVQNTPSTPVPTRFTTTEQVTTSYIPTSASTAPVQNTRSSSVQTTFNSTEHTSPEQLTTEHLTSGPLTTVPVKKPTTSNTTVRVSTGQLSTRLLTSDPLTTVPVQKPTTSNTTVRVSTEEATPERSTANQATTAYLPATTVPVGNTPSTPVPTTFNTTVHISTEHLTSDPVTTVPVQNSPSTSIPTTFNRTDQVSTEQLTTEHLNTESAPTVPFQSVISSSAPTTTEHASTEQLATEHLTSDPATPVPFQSVISSSAPTATEHASTEMLTTEHSTTEKVTTDFSPTRASNANVQNISSTSLPSTFNTTVHVSTEEATTKHLTTENVKHQSTTETADTEMQHSITQVTTEHTSALHITTVAETAPYSTTEPVSLSTVMPNEYSQGLSPGNLILIHENMTWNEALSYCREHHVDLVSITTELLQYWVTERAANATSSHVWVGLRFTCSFHFWFWIRSDAGCYQNWAPGHGSDSQQDCGIAGAVETTGRQQWVSLEENQRLNFICYKCSGDSGEGLIHP